MIVRAINLNGITDTAYRYFVCLQTDPIRKLNSALSINSRILSAVQHVHVFFGCPI